MNQSTSSPGFTITIDSRWPMQIPRLTTSVPVSASFIDWMLRVACVPVEHRLAESNARFWDLAPHHLEANEAYFQKN